MAELNEATYTGNPGTSARDALRLLIGDTDVTKATYSDPELDYFLGLALGDPQVAAQGVLAVAAGATAGSAGTRTIGKTTVTDGRSKAYTDALKTMQASPLGASSGSAVELFDRAGANYSIFDTGMDDYPGTAFPGTENANG